MKILAIDDNQDNLTVLRAVMTDHLPDAQVFTAISGSQGLELALIEDPDVILLDIVMPRMDGYTVCQKLKQDERLREIPVVFLTALRTDRESRIRALKVGAEGFLSKPFDETELIAQIQAMTKVKKANQLQRLEKEQLTVLVAERTQALERELAERRQAERSLRQTERDLKMVLNTVPALIWQKDKNGRYLQVNRKYRDTVGLSKEAILGKTDHEIFPPEIADKYVHHDQIALATGAPELGIEEHHLKASGELGWSFTDKMVYRDDQGNAQGTIGFALDITELKRAEEERQKLQAQVLQAQKLESIGRLAGGLAHDFNNMLSVINGHAELAFMKIGADQPACGDLNEIVRAAQRSADLTHKLLAFARKQTVMAEVIHLNTTIESMLKLLRRLIGEDILLTWLPGSSLWQVKMDPTQIDQILANLCVNARDAIAGVGEISIETSNVTLDKTWCDRHAEFTPGHYVMLTVRDSGAGMHPDTLGNIFEPFFTTKEVGKGTGLGLATVYGIVKQNNGFISVFSELKHGTLFRIYLPRHTGEDTQIAPPVVASTPSGEGETILLVEDEATILNLGQRMLEKLGYRVLTALTPDEAIHQAQTYPDTLHLLITDVIMPGMNGRDLANILLKHNPNLKCLFMSGYTADVIAQHGMLDNDTHFMAKPFSFSSLAMRVRAALES